MEDVELALANANLTVALRAELESKGLWIQIKQNVTIGGSTFQVKDVLKTYGFRFDKNANSAWVKKGLKLDFLALYKDLAQAMKKKPSSIVAPQVLGLSKGLPETIDRIRDMLPEAGNLSEAAAKGPKKLKGKALEKAVDTAYYKHGQNVQVDIFDLGKISKMGMDAYLAAPDPASADAALDAAMQAAIAKYRKN